MKNEKKRLKAIGFRLKETEEKAKGRGGSK